MSQPTKEQLVAYLREKTVPLSLEEVNIIINKISSMNEPEMPRQEPVPKPAEGQQSKEKGAKKQDEMRN